VLAVLNDLRSTVSRIGEVDTAFRIDPKVVGLVESGLVVLVREHRDVALRIDGGNPAAVSLTSEQVTVSVEEEAVRPAGILAIGG